MIRWPRSGVNPDEQIGALTPVSATSARQTPTVNRPRSRAEGPRRRPAPLTVRSRAVGPPAPGVQTYFTDRLIGRRTASPNTIGAYKVHLRAAVCLRRQATRNAPGALASRTSTRVGIQWEIAAPRLGNLVRLPERLAVAGCRRDSSAARGRESVGDSRPAPSRHAANLFDNGRQRRSAGDNQRRSPGGHGRCRLRRGLGHSMGQARERRAMK